MALAAKTTPAAAQRRAKRLRHSLAGFGEATGLRLSVKRRCCMVRTSFSSSVQRLFNRFNCSAAWIFAPDFPLHFTCDSWSIVLTPPLKGHLNAQ